MTSKLKVKNLSKCVDRFSGWMSTAGHKPPRMTATIL